MTIKLVAPWLPPLPLGYASKNAKTPREQGFHEMPEEGLEPPTRGL
jgi:hypothetical protein